MLMAIDSSPQTWFCAQHMLDSKPLTQLQAYMMSGFGFILARRQTNTHVKQRYQVKTSDIWLNITQEELAELLKGGVSACQRERVSEWISHTLQRAAAVRCQRLRLCMRVCTADTRMRGAARVRAVLEGEPRAAAGERDGCRISEHKNGLQSV
ncbi:hypothetical protein Q8A67_025774 [Cirrhinus molitorella]|uniref:Uncharacterized protein n=1 Tax=Cirrhinus molitorella TaxID=172907 RepID=A0AA88T8K5_9TELE|nr:hypothetical protein Q8A67_025774 [Cirrhinus molitorella]